MSLWDALGRLVLTGKVRAVPLVRGSRDGYAATVGRPWYRSLWIWFKAIVLNPPFMLGLGIAGSMVVLAMFAPLFTPYSPYQDATTLRVGGNLMIPPYPPGTADRFPLGTDFRGRDLWTLLLYGARQTLSIAAVVVLFRLLLGTVSGMLAGWFRGRWLDRSLMSLSAVAGAFPALLFGMVAILAADIRTGAQAFIIGLALTGWSEFAQYIRSETLAIREKPYIEGARTLGLPESALLLRHVLPNILPTLVIMAALEMSAVLIVIGELGFLGIMLGGGILDTDPAAMRTPRLVFNTPEWGALLVYARTAMDSPWMVIYPSLAFTLAILGFNFLGEGLRRLLEHTELALTRFFKLRYFTTIAVLVAIYLVVSNLLSPTHHYAGLATGFNEQQAMQYTRALSDPRFGGRRAGTPNEQAAAAWIADRYRELGLEPGGDNGSYFQEFSFTATDLAATPTLEVKSADNQVLDQSVQHRDFAEALNIFTGDQPYEGTADGETAFVGWGMKMKGYDDYDDINIADKVVLMLQGGPPEGIDDKLNLARLNGAAAILLIARDPLSVTDRIMDISPDLLGQNNAATHPQIGLYDTLYSFRLVPPSQSRIYERRIIPFMVITRQTADKLLQGSGYTADQLYNEFDSRLHAAYAENRPLKPTETHSFALKTLAEVSVVTKLEKRTSRNVIGYLPGSNGTTGQSPIIFATHYDYIGEGPNGTIYPGANSASATGVMLEMARLAQAQKILLHKPVIFIAFGAGELELSGSRYYVNNPRFPVDDTSAFILLDRLGDGADEAMLVNTADFGYYTRLRDGAKRMGVATSLDQTIPKSDMASFAGHPIQVARLTYPGQDRTIYRTSDTVSPDNLRAAGRVAYYLMLEFGEN